MSTPVCRITSRKGKVTEYADIDDAWADIALCDALHAEPSLYFLGVVGTRRRNDHLAEMEVWDTIEAFVSGHYNVEVVIVSGDCATGAAHHAQHWAIANKTTLIEFPAQWDLYGKSAGFKRNEHIARLADELLAQVAPDRTGGTENTIAHFERLHPTLRARLI